MFKKLLNKNPLFFAFLFPALVDGIITLVGQSSDYWQGVKVVNEASPAYYFLLISPWFYILGGVIWFAFWYLIFKKVKDSVKFFFMFLFIAGHSWGSSTWIMKMFRDNHIYTLDNRLSIIFAWSLLIVYFSLIALFASYCLEIYTQSQKH